MSLQRARRQLIDIMKSYPLALSKLWTPYCHRWDGFGSKSNRVRGCGSEMRMIGLGVYKCDKCDVEEKRTSQREAAIRFESSQEAYLCTGGNRAGKTQFGAQLAVAIAAGSDEWWVREWIKNNDLPKDLVQRKPQTVWYVALSYGDALEYGRPKLEQYAPQGTKYSRWGAQDRASMRLPNGGRIVSLSDSAGREAFQGSSVKFVWCDEEPSQEVFEECMLRTVDTRGKCLITATPLKGLSFM